MKLVDLVLPYQISASKVAWNWLVQVSGWVSLLRFQYVYLSNWDWRSQLEMSVLKPLHKLKVTKGWKEQLIENQAFVLPKNYPSKRKNCFWSHFYFSHFFIHMEFFWYFRNKFIFPIFSWDKTLLHQKVFNPLSPGVLDPGNFHFFTLQTKNAINKRVFKIFLKFFFYMVSYYPLILCVVQHWY